MLRSEKRRIEKKIVAFGKDNLYLSREVYTRIIVIDFIIVKLFGVCPVIFFPSKRKSFLCKYLYSCVWLLFWIANICDNIVWDPTSGIRARLKWKRWPEKKARVQELRNLMEQTSRIGGCRLKIIFMKRNCICLFWGRNLKLWMMKTRIFLIDRYWELFD